MDLQQVKQRFSIIGNAPALNYALSVAIRVAPTNLTVLITGESGVGKEVFSKILHQLSARKHNSFIAVNCGAIPEGTIDSELFGHEKGSFTGANEKRKGYFETVDGGTIFLDEIGEMPLGTQARLLRILESGEFIKVGSSQVQKTDVRVVAATNVNLLEQVQKGKFREDLYYRLSTVPIEIPPLRERGEDIVLLFRKFASDFAEKNHMPTLRLDEEATQLLLRYNWPGNVRQLKNTAEQCSVLAKDSILGKDELLHFLPDISQFKTPALYQGNGGSNQNESANFSERELLYKMLFDIKRDINDLKSFILSMSNGNPTGSYPVENSFSNPTHVAQDNFHYDNQPIVIRNKNEINEHETVDESLSLNDQERELIIKALRKHRGRRRDAAEDLGISERTLYRKIKEYDIAE